MCIRDRLIHRDSPRSRQKEDQDQASGTLNFGWKPQPLSHCLLYTSDAADERSSVDLGGRRIIKKKKHPTDAGCVTSTTTTDM